MKSICHPRPPLYPIILVEFDHLLSISTSPARQHIDTRKMGAYLVRAENSIPGRFQLSQVRVGGKDKQLS